MGRGSEKPIAGPGVCLSVRPSVLFVGTGTRPIPFSATRHPRSHASKTLYRRSGRPSRRGACHPCGDHNKGQGLVGHHTLLVDHRTLQASYHQDPFEVEGTWGDDRPRRRGEQASANVHGGRVYHRGMNAHGDHHGAGHPCSGHRGSDHLRDGRRDDNCPGHAESRNEIWSARDQQRTYVFLQGDSDRLTTKILAVKFFDRSISILSGNVFQNAVILNQRCRDESRSRTHPVPTLSRSISAKDTLPASRPKSLRS